MLRVRPSELTECKWLTPRCDLLRRRRRGGGGEEEEEEEEEG